MSPANQQFKCINQVVRGQYTGLSQMWTADQEGQNYPPKMCLFIIYPCPNKPDSNNQLVITFCRGLI